jgi:hypothetical protein
VVKRLLLACALAGCGAFEEPSIVLDLRVIGMVADPPEQIVHVDLNDPAGTDVVDQLEPVMVTAYIADPDKHRKLRWSMMLCLVDKEGRCDLSKPYKDMGGGEIEDPDDYAKAQHPSAEVFGDRDVNYFVMLREAIEANPVQALGGVDLTVMLRVGGVDEPPENDIYAAKLVRISPDYPAGRAANKNPEIDDVDSASTTDPGAKVGERRCADTPTTVVAASMQAGGTITLFPLEHDGTREHYVAPTLDGGSVMLDESLSYQWLATAGSWSDETTGGGHDILGNQSLLGSDWTAPRVVPHDNYRVSIWMIQRDERLGVRVYETCISVSP